MKEILVLGSGVAGSSVTHFLSKKGYKVNVIEKLKGAGGLARTYYYAGHPYEFGPHVWFWPGGPENEVNAVVNELTKGELYTIDRKLFSYVECDSRDYRYPIHFEDISSMPESDTIFNELQTNRDETYQLKSDCMPIIGECTFEEYFSAAIGNTLYSKFMKDYTHKMWNIPGDELQTRMVWADRFNHTYSDSEQGGMKGYDPLKFENHTLGKGIAFQVYPKKGWNDVWDNMVKDANIIEGEVATISGLDSRPYISLKDERKFFFDEYEYVINTIDLDNLWGEDCLPYTGRMMLPLVVPRSGFVFPDGAESLHFSSAEFVTRITEMKTITRYESDDSLILIEVPILPGAEDFFPENTIQYAKENNLYCGKAYPQQSTQAIEMYDGFVKKGNSIQNLLNCGRHAEFRYWGMPETVNAALQLCKTIPAAK